jgi:death-on-curing protein
MVKYLLPEQIMFLHSRLIQETGGLQGLRDLSMLLSASGRPQATYGGEDLYADVFSKAAALLDSLIRNHPFTDGNKRTAITAAAIFLEVNGYRLVVDPDEMVSFTLDCAQGKVSIGQITDWLRKYSRG